MTGNHCRCRLRKIDATATISKIFWGCSVVFYGMRKAAKENGQFCPFFICGAGFMQIVELIEQAVTGLGYELVDFETSPRARLLRIFIDRPAGAEPVAVAGEAPTQGGISVDDCVAVSNHLSRLFTVENIDYDRLEVSSPGMDRPLKKAADFERFAGKEAQVKLRIPVGNQRNFSGVLGGLKEGGLVLVSEGIEHVFPLDNVEKARLIPKF